GFPCHQGGGNGEDGDLPGSHVHKPAPLIRVPQQNTHRRGSAFGERRPGRPSPRRTRQVALESGVRTPREGLLHAGCKGSRQAGTRGGSSSPACQARFVSSRQLTDSFQHAMLRAESNLCVRVWLWTSEAPTRRPGFASGTWLAGPARRCGRFTCTKRWVCCC